MGDFKKYFFSDKNINIEETEKNISNSISSDLSLINNTKELSLTEKQKEDFGNKVSSLVHSEDFIQELSDIIGSPRINESEDDFVKRAKKLMKNLLTEKFLK